MTAHRPWGIPGSSPRTPRRPVAPPWRDLLASALVGGFILGAIFGALVMFWVVEAVR